MNKPEPMTDEQCDAIWPSPEGTNSIRAVIHAAIWTPKEQAAIALAIKHGILRDSFVNYILDQRSKK